MLLRTYIKNWSWSTEKWNRTLVRQYSKWDLTDFIETFKMSTTNFLYQRLVLARNWSDYFLLGWNNQFTYDFVRKHSELWLSEDGFTRRETFRRVVLLFLASPTKFSLRFFTELPRKISYATEHFLSFHENLKSHWYTNVIFSPENSLSRARIQIWKKTLHLRCNFQNFPWLRNQLRNVLVIRNFKYYKKSLFDEIIVQTSDLLMKRILTEKNTNSLEFSETFISSFTQKHWSLRNTATTIARSEKKREKGFWFF